MNHLYVKIEVNSGGPSYKWIKIEGVMSNFFRSWRLRWHIVSLEKERRISSSAGEESL